MSIMSAIPDSERAGDERHLGQQNASAEPLQVISHFNGELHSVDAVRSTTSEEPSRQAGDTGREWESEADDGGDHDRNEATETAWEDRHFLSVGEDLRCLELK